MPLFHPNIVILCLKITQPINKVISYVISVIICDILNNLTHLKRRTLNLADHEKVKVSSECKIIKEYNFEEENACF